MTYDDANVPWAGEFQTLCRSDIQAFLKDVRNACRVRVGGKRVNRSPRWFVTGEYGPTTDRPHYHALIFNVPQEIVPRLRSLWKRGFITVKPVTEKRINYACKYQIMLHGQESFKGKREKPFRICTKSTGGLGKQWLTYENKVYAKLQLSGMVHLPSGFVPMPKYYRDRVGFTAMERDQIREKTEGAIYDAEKKLLEELSALGYPQPERELAYRNSFKVAKMYKKFTKTHQL